MRRALAWLLYYLGDLMSRADALPERFYLLGFFRAYQKLMAWSVEIQGAGNGPWQPPHN